MLKLRRKKTHTMTPIKVWLVHNRTFNSMAIVNQPHNPYRILFQMDKCIISCVSPSFLAKLKKTEKVFPDNLF